MKFYQTVLIIVRILRLTLFFYFVYVFCKCVKFGCVFFLEFLAENHFHKIKCIAKRHLYMLKFIYVQV